MTTKNTNIAASNIVGRCDSKCSYSFKYSETNLTARNSYDMLTFMPDSSAPPVIYNREKYNLGNIEIYSPSLHVYDNEKLQGEIVIVHNPVKGGKALIVSIPFISSIDTSIASKSITSLIDTVANNAPSTGSATNLNISDFNLQKIVPRNPFFMYSMDYVDWIVFGKLDAIPISSATITKLQKMIKPARWQPTGTNLYYNSKGPIAGVQVGDGIYISCRPTGSSDKEIAVEYDKALTESSNSGPNIFENKIFKTFVMIILFIVLFVILFYGVSMFYNYLSKDNSQSSALSSFSFKFY
jgi:carbonic anhydrase